MNTAIDTQLGSLAGAMTTNADFADDEARWAAVTRRDRSADGAFVYAVVTTGVYCRPSCASRPALRKNVRFFDRPAGAERAGFRACKRCRPTQDDPRDIAAARMVQACRLLEQGTPARTDQVARAVGMSAFHFQRTFKKHVGVTPQAYRRRVVNERAKQAVTQATSVTRAIYDAGFGSSSRFYEGPGAELGMTPRRARAGGSGEHVRYVVRRCSLGVLLVAWTDRGACDVRFGSSDREVSVAIRERFPAARVERALVPGWVDAVVEAVERPRALDIPLDIEGTAFQERVWQELRRIPPGETRSYGQIAAAIGAPRAVRAVASACASNHLAVAIPCHRVVRADGSASGYRWGPERKKALLRREAGE